MAKSKKSGSKRARKKSSRVRSVSSALVTLDVASSQSPKTHTQMLPRKKSKKHGQSEPSVEPPFAIQSAEEDISWNSAYEADLSQQSTSTTWRSRSFWFATLLITAVGTTLVFDDKISSVNPVISSSVSSDTSNALDPATFWQQRSQSSIKSDYGSDIVEQVELKPFESDGTTQSPESEDSFEESYPSISADQIPYNPLKVLDGSNIDSKTNRAEATTIITKTPPPKPVRVVINATGEKSFSQALVAQDIAPNVALDIVSVIDPVFDVEEIEPGTELELLLDRQQDFNGNAVVFPIQVAFTTSTGLRVVVDADAEAQFTVKIYTNGVENVQQRDAKAFYRVRFVDGIRVRGAADLLQIPGPVTDTLIKLISRDLKIDGDIISGGQVSFLYGPSLDDPSSSEKLLYYVETSTNENVNRYYSFSPKLGGDRNFFTMDGLAIGEITFGVPPRSGKVISSFGDDIKIDGSATVVNFGVNLAAGAGTRILATAPGKISEIGQDEAFGTYVILDHIGGYRSYYGRLDPLEGGLKVGQSLNKGETIGFVATEDNISQPYFHFRLYLNGQPVDPVKHGGSPPEQLSGNDLKNFRIEQSKLVNLLRAALPL